MEIREGAKGRKEERRGGGEAKEQGKRVRGRKEGRGEGGVDAVGSVSRSEKICANAHTLSTLFPHHHLSLSLSLSQNTKCGKRA